MFAFPNNINMAVNVSKCQSMSVALCDNVMLPLVKEILYLFFFYAAHAPGVASSGVCVYLSRGCKLGNSFLHRSCGWNKNGLMQRGGTAFVIV